MTGWFFWVCVLIALFILVIGALRAREQPFSALVAPTTQRKRRFLNRQRPILQAIMARWISLFALVDRWRSCLRRKMDRTAKDFNLASNSLTPRSWDARQYSRATRRLIDKDVCLLPVSMVVSHSRGQSRSGLYDLIFIFKTVNC